MSHIEFVYYDTVYNESVFTHTYNGPFVDKMDFELINTQEGLYEHLFLFFMTLMGRLWPKSSVSQIAQKFHVPHLGSLWRRICSCYSGNLATIQYLTKKDQSQRSTRCDEHLYPHTPILQILDPLWCTLNYDFGRVDNSLESNRTVFIYLVNFVLVIWSNRNILLWVLDSANVHSNNPWAVNDDTNATYNFLGRRRIGPSLERELWTKGTVGVVMVLLLPVICDRSINPIIN